MTYNEIFDKVAELIVAQLPVTIEQVKPESRLVEDLGADSANVMILVFDLEREFTFRWTTTRWPACTRWTTL